MYVIMKVLTLHHLCFGQKYCWIWKLPLTLMMFRAKEESLNLECTFKMLVFLSCFEIHFIEYIVVVLFMSTYCEI